MNDGSAWNNADDSDAREVLRQALIEGEENGPSTVFEFEAFIARKRIGA